MSSAPPPQILWRVEITDVWKTLLVHALPTLLLLVMGGLALQLGWRAMAPRLSERVQRAMRRAFVGIAVVVGTLFALRKASLFDDAFISFRYAKNMLDGHGLVWNIGERVEGYTNFLWTVMVALVSAVTRVEIPWVGLVLSVLAFALNLVIVARLSTVLARAAHPGTVALPLAALVLAAQDTFHTYGTTGLETGFASLLVNTGALLLVSQTTPRAAFVAGLVFILAVLTRPDHSLFYIVGAFVVFTTHLMPVVRARNTGPRGWWTAGISSMAAYAAPFTIYLAYLAWKLSFYGSIVPNTYYAKSANLSYWIQGEIYMRAFALQSHAWIVVVIALIVAPFAWRANETTRRYVLFAIPASLAYVIYVWKVGGDFMHGRFYVSVLPLVVVLACLAPEVVPAPRRFPRLMPGLVLASLCFVLAQSLDFFHDARGRWMIRWHIAEERTVYPITSIMPLEVDRYTWPVGHTLARLKKVGISPRIAAPGIGVIGYYSELELIDMLGLTDATVAQQIVTTRGRPGHEKWAAAEYINRRAPHFIGADTYTPARYRDLVEIRLGQDHRKWRIYRYDRALMQQIRAADPSIRFIDLEAHLDGVIATLDERTLHDVRQDFAFFKSLYFDHNDDSARQRRFEEWIAAHAAKATADDTASPP